MPVLTSLWSPEEIRLARIGQLGDDVIAWRRAMLRACAANLPHHVRYVDPRTGRVLTTTPPCAHTQEGN